MASNASADRFTRFNYNKYWGLGLWNIKYSPEDAADSEDYGMLGAMGRFGWEATRWFALEGYIGATESDSQEIFDGTAEVELRVRYLTGVMAKFSLLWQQNQGWARFYGLLGASFVDVEAKSGDVKETDTESGGSYGLGVELYGNDRTAVVLEYVRYIHHDDFNLDSPLLGFNYRF